jgi:DnaJ-class molecular chaperone
MPSAVAKKQALPAIPKGMLRCDWCKGAGHFPNKYTLIGSGVKKKHNCSHCDGKGYFPPFTDQDKQDFKAACYATWSAIGGDAERCTIEAGAKLTNAAVVEMTLDADYMDMYGMPYGLKDKELEAHKMRIRQIRYSGRLATKLCKEALFG